jgi:transketolase
MAENLFDLASKKVKKKMRQEFADTMLEVGQKDPRLAVLIGDISHFILQPFAKACPGRFYNIGICEQAIVNMAAGLSKTGFFPVVHTISPFIIERAFEQIKLDFGYQKLGVNLITVGSAFDYCALGCTHHCYDDFALLKNVDRMEIIHPASCKEFNLLFKQTYNNGHPTYFRIPENQHNVEFKDEEIIFGKGILVREGKDVTIIALGPQLRSALDSVEPLKRLGIDPEIIYIHTIKPLDEEMINKSLAKTKKCLVVEEHSKYGGVFDDVLRCSKDLDVKYSAINIGSGFIHSYGSYEQHCKRIGLSPEGIFLETLKLVRE